MPSEKTLVPAANGDDLLALVELALEEAKVLGATQAEAAVSVDVGLSVSVRLGEVETVEYQRDRGMGVTVYFGTRKGSASTADLGAAGLRETVAKACSIARFTAEDPCAGLAGPGHARAEIPDLSLSHPWELTPDQACELALACESAAMGVDPRITNSEGAGVSTSPRPACLRDFARLPRRLSEQRCTASAARCSAPRARPWSATTGTRPRVTGASSRMRPASGAARRARGPAPRRAQDAHDESAGALQSRTRARPHRPFRRRDARWQPVPARLVPARMPPGSRYSPTGSRSRSDPHMPGRSPARRSTTRASRRATASSSPAACCSATCSAPIRRASSGCARPAMPAAPTT